MSAEPATNTTTATEAEKTLNRRYVGTKETFAYILDDIAQSFNIGKYDDVFRMNILKIALSFQAIANAVIGVWDIINDIFLAAIVDKTRTRWGKFKPWLVIYAIPGVFLTVVYWALPIFLGTDGVGHNAARFAVFLILQIFSNLAASLIAIVRQGMTATITPNIVDRTRLITMANLLSGFVEKAPEILFGLLIDIYNNSNKELEQIDNLAYQSGYNKMFVMPLLLKRELCRQLIVRVSSAVLSLLSQTNRSFLLLFLSSSAHSALTPVLTFITSTSLTLHQCQQLSVFPVLLYLPSPILMFRGHVRSSQQKHSGLQAHMLTAS